MHLSQEVVTNMRSLWFVLIFLALCISSIAQGTYQGSVSGYAYTNTFAYTNRSAGAAVYPAIFIISATSPVSGTANFTYLSGTGTNLITSVTVTAAISIVVVPAAHYWLGLNDILKYSDNFTNVQVGYRWSFEQ